MHIKTSSLVKVTKCFIFTDAKEQFFREDQKNSETKTTSADISLIIIIKYNPTITAEKQHKE